MKQGVKQTIKEIGRSSATAAERDECCVCQPFIALHHNQNHLLKYVFGWNQSVN